MKSATGDISEILKKVRRIELKTRGLVQDGIAGAYRAGFKGRGIDFEDFREYQHGDEIRTIDWNVTARLGTPYVKRFSEERELTMFLIVDVSASNDFGSKKQSKRELAAEVAAVLAFSAMQNKDKVGLILFSNDVELCLPPKRGAGHCLRVIREILYRDPLGVETNPSEALRTLTNINRRRCLAFLISDFLFDPASQALSSASAKHDLVAIQVRDPVEDELPKVGILRLVDPETGAQVEINTSDPATRQAYTHHRKLWQEKLDAYFRKHTIDVIKLTTSDSEDYLPELRAFFHKRQTRQT